MTLVEPQRSVIGTTRFIRYAFMPNRLQYCGGDDNRTILEYALEDVREPPLMAMLRKFNGAAPYLTLIAERNNILDPFDERVVEAYWLGNELLDRVEASELYEHIKMRLGGRATPRALARVAAKAPAGARPHHSFHVFDLARHAEPGDEGALAALDSCRISWGTVRAVEAAELVVDRRPVILRGGRLTLAEARAERVTRVLEGRGFTANAQIGDIVSIHWNWVCEILNERQLKALERYTELHLKLANQTL